MPLQRLLDVGVAELAHRLLDRQPLPLRQLELRPHLDVELERQGALLGHLHRLEIEIRLADRRELLLLVHLREAVHQQFALDLLGDVLAEAGLDQLPRRMAGTEARHVRGRHQLGELLVEVPLDVLVRDRHGDVPLARAAVLDLDLQGEPLGFLFLFRDGRVGSGFRTSSVKSAVFAVSHDRSRQPRLPIVLARAGCKERVMGFEPTTTTLATSCSTN